MGVWSRSYRSQITYLQIITWVLGGLQASQLHHTVLIDGTDTFHLFLLPSLLGWQLFHYPPSRILGSSDQVEGAPESLSSFSKIARADQAHFWDHAVVQETVCKPFFHEQYPIFLVFQCFSSSWQNEDPPCSLLSRYPPCPTFWHVALVLLTHSVLLSW